jgi:hypothetical protein
MSVIDVGPGATDRAGSQGYGDTYIDIDNPANASGIINSVELWFDTNASGVKVGVFYGSGTAYTCHGYVSIGSVTAGSKQTFAVNLAVQSGDFLGVYFTGGDIDYGGTGTIYIKAGDHTADGYNTGYASLGAPISIYATGITPPAAPTGLAATDGTHIDKVVPTWTKPSGAITGNKVYRDGGLIDTIGDVETYDDTGADAATIPVEASKGIYQDKVSLEIGEITYHSYTYKVVAYNAAGDSPDSNTDTGYRGVGATYQWQRSASVNATDYGNITGATTEEYDDTGAPANGSRRWYRCLVAGIASEVDRGWRRVYIDGRPVTVLVKEPDGTLLAYLKNIFQVDYKKRSNELATCQFQVLSNDPELEHLVYPNEVYLYQDGRLIDIFKVVDREAQR